ncbi:MAG: hypothetical protein GY697_01995 [Desulfobacterales bacterium]|nr:hypothetical protein [Desulfobacterales bacterium]
MGFQKKSQKEMSCRMHMANTIECSGDSVQNIARDIMEKAEKNLTTIDSMRAQMWQVQVDRIRSGKCGLDQGRVFINLLTNCEKVGDDGYNVAEAAAGVK